MSIHDSKSIEQINKENILAAGPRYSPIMDPSAPNLKIQSLLNNIEALALTDKYRDSLLTLEKALNAAHKAFSKDGTIVFPKHESPTFLAGLFALLRNRRAGRGGFLLARMTRLTEHIINKIDEKQKELWDQEQDLEEYSDEKRAIELKISNLQRLRSALSNIAEFSSSPLSSLIIQNRMLILGEWGMGKTHFLCDITQQRMNRNLPTLFFLAHRLPQTIDPLKAICLFTKIADSPEDLLKKMDRLGRASGGRALIIIDGINEASRAIWRKNVEGVARAVARYPNVGLVLSCRVPFDKQIFTSRAYTKFVKVRHPGFQEIEFDAQRAFFEHYKIPNPHIPLLTPEFSRPLFLKILCQTFSGSTSTVRKRMVQKIAEGKESMTKLFEDFVKKIGRSIEDDFGLPYQTCWRLLKEHKLPSGEVVGVAVSMAKSLKDHISPQECAAIIKQVCECKKNSNAQAILERLLTEGLLTEDIVWENRASIIVIRFPYQRFSDHLICRYLLQYYLDKDSPEAIRRSFRSDRPLGKIFEIDQFGHSYQMPGLASAMMLDFPERVKKTLPPAERELVFYLPKRRRLLSALAETFLEGLLWRDRDSFSGQTDRIINTLIKKGGKSVERQTLEALVCLACRPGHPYSAQWLYGHLEGKTIVERDILWSEFLRNSERESVVYRLLDWVEGPGKEEIVPESVENLSLLLSLFLTTTQRALRDRVTKALVLIGDKHPNILFNVALKTLAFNDPYVPERMLAACYGTLMRTWAFPSDELKVQISIFVQKLYDLFFAAGAVYSTKHILTVDYALGVIELARRINPLCLGKRSYSRLRAPFRGAQTPIPEPDSIRDIDCKPASRAISMDFENYTVGRLVADRHNYDFTQKDYVDVLKQIKWRILNLGYKAEIFETIDRSIAQSSYYQEQKHRAGKIDRYGKKYSWIAYFEVAGIQTEKGFIQNPGEARISDVDIDPSFPQSSNPWKPPLDQLFQTKFHSAREWIVSGETPSYDHLCKLENVDGIKGPWILLRGHIEESAGGEDPRRTFTFLNGLLVNKVDLSKIKEKFESTEHPGNSRISQLGTDYYTFVGEIPWSYKYAYQLRKKSGKSKRYIAEIFDERKEVKILKKYTSLTERELLDIALMNSISKKSTGMLEDLPEYIEISKYINIPGTTVEFPVYLSGWESYHSLENQADIGEFLAPALCEMSNLRNQGGSVDLVDSSGMPATLYRSFGKSGEPLQSTLFYVREDILSKYLISTKQKMVWMNWGERSFEYNYSEKIRSTIQDIWSSHGYLFRKMITSNLNE